MVGFINTPPSWLGPMGVVYNCDCADLMAQMPDNSIDLIIADPPYGVSWNHGCLSNDSIGSAIATFASFLRQATRVLKKGSCCCCFCSSSGRASPVFVAWIDLLQTHLRYKKTVIWDKRRMGLGTHYRQTYEYILIAFKGGSPCRWYGPKNVCDILRYNRERPGETIHPTPKPVPLLSKLISLHSATGDIVLDPFCGSGSTLVAARQLGRNFIGVELSELFAGESAYRLQKAS